MEQRDHLLGVVQTLWNWRKSILLVCVAAVLGTAIISLFLPNYYRATTVFLATSPDQAKPDALFSAREYYGNANDVDRLLTIAESNELVEFLVDTFNLYEHYDINKQNPRAAYNVRQKFFSLYEVKKNKRDAIELSVEDRDRELAARIANAAREKIDEIAQKLVKEGQAKAIQTFENQIQVKQALLKNLSDTLIVLSNTYGIYNNIAQT
ncbi:MAG: Wzz/FepE/Etk N-terminal domain-containing protein, partial [Saprospiraceae bacterium]